MTDFTIRQGGFCPVCRGIVLRDCSHTMRELRDKFASDAGRDYDALAAENAALRAELAFARSTGDESALEYHALKAQLAEVTAQRDTAEANLARLQDRWDARPATEELEARLAEARDARDLAEGKLIAYERMAERIHTYCRELSDGENVRLTDYEPWEAWLELDGALAELRRAIADSAFPVNEFPQGAVSVLNPQGTEETGNDRPAAPILGSASETVNGVDT